MKQIILLILLAFTLSGCVVIQTEDVTQSPKLSETSVAMVAETENKETREVKKVNHMTEREFSFDDRIDFKYTGSDKILEAITDHMVEEAKKFFGGQGALEIPTPYIVKIDDSNGNDIKVYGNFCIYGYELYGTIFHNKNGGSFPGCYHLKKESDGYSYIKHEIAEDGSKNYESLVKICGGDENLAKAIFSVANEEDAATRIKYVKMYRDDNNLRISGIKDYGWPIILFDDISNPVFAYNFYKAYFDEFKQEDSLNDFAERIDRLKEKYMTSECIEEVDERTADVGADMVINAQDVTDEMMDTLQATDMGDGKVLITMEAGREEPTRIELTIKKMGKTLMIVSLK